MVTIIKQSGNPVDESEAKKFLDEWKDGFDKLFDSKGDMAIVSEKAKAFEEELLKKYKLEKQVAEYMPFMDIQGIDIANDENDENVIHVSIRYFVRNISAFDQIKLTVAA